MSNLLLSFLGLFPVSFLVYVFSERVNATHQSRVGKAIEFPGFIQQSWVDTCAGIKKIKSFPEWVLFAIQYSILFFIQTDVEAAFIVYLVLNFAALAVYGVWRAKKETETVDVYTRVETNRLQIQFVFASVLAFISSYACFGYNHTLSLNQIEFQPALILFLIPFQIAGMIFFGEFPFVAFEEKKEWLRSARFYVWCVLATKLFLGGGLLFFDLHLKAAILFVGCRLIGLYFPRYQQKDLLRIGILYLIPSTTILWLVVMLLHGVLSGGGHA